MCMVKASTGRAGYRLEAAEVERLCAAMDIGRTGWLAKSQLAASQIDWQALQARLHAWRPTYHTSGLHCAGCPASVALTSKECRMKWHCLARNGVMSKHVCLYQEVVVDHDCKHTGVAWTSRNKV